MLGWLSMDGDVPGGGLPSASGGLPLDGENGQVVRCRAGGFDGLRMTSAGGFDGLQERASAVHKILFFGFSSLRD
jgi:hypothetical protein